MTDSRPSENTDDRPFEPAEMRRRGFFDDLFDEERPDPVADFIERATNAHDPAHGLVYAQLATVEQLRKLITAIEATAESVRELLKAGDDL